MRSLLLLLTFATALSESLASVRSVSDVQISNVNVPADKDTGVSPIDQPDVYFDSDELSLSLYGWDNTLVSYYVEVEDSSSSIVASETVPGYGWQTVYLDPNTSSGTATVTITTSRGDEYTGTFYIC